MKKSFFLLLAIVAMGFVASGQKSFTLYSKQLGGQASKVEEFNGFGCEGQNQSPDLRWENAPDGTESFAITMYDPDAPTGSGWWHWLAFDIPATVSNLPQGAGQPGAGLMPEGAIQSLTNYGVAGYGGPCPPPGHGAHQYIITVYALKTASLGLEEQTNPAIVGYYLWNNSLAKASIVAYYERAE